VGPFDENFKLYFEETDWLLRLVNRGHKALYVPTAEAVHLYNQSAGYETRAKEWFTSSASLFCRRHYGRWFTSGLDRFLGSGRSNLNDPPCLPPGRPELDLGSGHQGLWVELGSSPLGFPAAAAVIEDADLETWRLPEEVWHHLTPGQYNLQVVDEAGRELSRFLFERRRPPEAEEENFNTHLDLGDCGRPLPNRTS
jgi:hypothetical protein